MPFRQALQCGTARGRRAMVLCRSRRCQSKGGGWSVEVLRSVRRLVNRVGALDAKVCADVLIRSGHGTVHQSELGRL